MNNNELNKKIKRHYLDGIKKMYYCQDPDKDRRRSTAHCKKCLACFGWYDRFDFDAYNDIPKLCIHCASEEPWWEADPYVSIWNTKQENVREKERLEKIKYNL